MSRVFTSWCNKVFLVQHWLGYSAIKTTMDSYGKILEKDKDEVARKIEQWHLQMES